MLSALFNSLLIPVKLSVGQLPPGPCAACPLSTHPCCFRLDLTQEPDTPQQKYVQSPHWGHKTWQPLGSGGGQTWALPGRGKWPRFKSLLGHLPAM